LVPSVAPGCRKIIKRTAFNPDFLQVIEERAQKLFAEAGSDSPGEFKALAFVKANEQCAEVFPRPFRLGISADHEFLFLVELDLDPYSGPSSGLQLRFRIVLVVVLVVVLGPCFCPDKKANFHGTVLCD
jgi:hypothetical protein